MHDIQEMINDMGAKAQKAAAVLAKAPATQKSQALDHAADRIEADMARLLAANAEDMEYGRQKGLSAPMLDRLELNEERVAAMCQGVREVAAQEDPVGRTLASWERPNGLRIERVSTPIGVIGVIYESRPNVTADAAALCLKSGNGVILRGGSESFLSAGVIAEGMRAGLKEAGLPIDAIQKIPTRDRAAVQALLQAVQHVDVIVPRGGKGLVSLVQREARVPVFAHLDGIVHIYIDKDADPVKALKVVLNSKTRRTGICGAAECLLIHSDVTQTVGEGVLRALLEAGVEVRTDAVLGEIAGTVAAQDGDWGFEFQDKIIAARQVADVDEAIAHIAAFGSNHTDAILTENEKTAAHFFKHVDSAIVMQNASTQFADGGEFGMGAEIGIATGKLHARGPIGASQLTTFQYHVRGDGTTRP